MSLAARSSKPALAAKPSVEKTAVKPVPVKAAAKAGVTTVVAKDTASVLAAAGLLWSQLIGLKVHGIRQATAYMALAGLLAIIYRAMAGTRGPASVVT